MAKINGKVAKVGGGVTRVYGGRGGEVVTGTSDRRSVTDW